MDDLVRHVGEHLPVGDAPPWDGLLTGTGEERVDGELVRLVGTSMCVASFHYVLRSTSLSLDEADAGGGSVSLPAPRRSASLPVGLHTVTIFPIAVTRNS